MFGSGAMALTRPTDNTDRSSFITVDAVVRSLDTQENYPNQIGKTRAREIIVQRERSVLTLESRGTEHLSNMRDSADDWN